MDCPLKMQTGVLTVLLQKPTRLEEVCGIARKSAQINLIVCYPKTEEGRRELAERVAGAHADFVNQYIRKLNCPPEQKVKLLNKIIASASQGEPDKHIL